MALQSKAEFQETISYQLEELKGKFGYARNRKAFLKNIKQAKKEGWINKQEYNQLRNYQKISGQNIQAESYKQQQAEGFKQILSGHAQAGQQEFRVPEQPSTNIKQGETSPLSFSFDVRATSNVKPSDSDYGEQTRLKMSLPTTSALSDYTGQTITVSGDRKPTIQEMTGNPVIKDYYTRQNPGLLQEFIPSRDLNRPTFFGIKEPDTKDLRIFEYNLNKQAGISEIKAIRGNIAGTPQPVATGKSIALNVVNTPVRALNRPMTTTAVIGASLLTKNVGVATSGFAVPYMTGLTIGGLTAGYEKERQAGGSGAKTIGTSLFIGGVAGYSYLKNWRPSIKKGSGKQSIKILDKKGSVGGRSAKQRSGKISKAQLRKNSYNAQRNNKIFIDKQKGELGIRIKNKELKQQFTKERVIRFDKGGKITNIKDVQIGGKGSLNTKYGVGGGSYKGKGSQIKISKLYPKGYGSQSLSGGGKQQTLGVTIISRKGFKFNLAKPGKIPKSSFVNKGASVTTRQLLKQPKSTPTIYNKRQVFAGDVITKPGFRAGTYTRVKTSFQQAQLDRSRNVLIKDLGKFRNFLPKVNTGTRITPDITTTVKPGFNFRTLSATTLKLNPIVTGAGLSTSINFNQDQGIDTERKQNIKYSIAQSYAYQNLFKRPQKQIVDTPGGFPTNPDLPGSRPRDNVKTAQITPISPILPTPTGRPRPRTRDDQNKRPRIPKVPKLPKFDFGLPETKFSSKSKGISSKSQYRPSLEAITFDISGSMPKTITPYSLRPKLLKKKKKARL